MGSPTFAWLHRSLQADCVPAQGARGPRPSKLKISMGTGAADFALHIFCRAPHFLGSRTVVSLLWVGPFSGKYKFGWFVERRKLGEVVRNWPKAKEFVDLGLAAFWVGSLYVSCLLRKNSRFLVDTRKFNSGARGTSHPHGPMVHASRGSQGGPVICLNNQLLDH